MTATPVPTLASPVVLAEPTKAPVMESAEFSFPMSEPTKGPPLPRTAAPFATSAFEPRQEPTPEGLHDQMARCLQFDAERGSPSGTSVYGVVMLRVVARNSCDVGFSGGEVWFEATAIPPSGGIAGRATGRFQTAIPARGFAETFIQIDGVRSDAFYYYKASIWWAAGGGRRAGE